MEMLLTILPKFAESSDMFARWIQLLCTVVLSHIIPSGLGLVARSAETLS